MKLGELMRDYVDHEFMGPIYAGIDEATWPWKLRPITFMNEFDIVEFEDYVLMEGRYGKDLGHIFWFKLPLPRGLVIEPEAMQNTFVNEFTHSFRTWRVEPEDNIILGTE